MQIVAYYRVSTKWGSTHSAKASALAFNVTARSASQILDIRVAETLDHTARAVHPRIA